MPVFYHALPAYASFVSVLRIPNSGSGRRVFGDEPRWPLANIACEKDGREDTESLSHFAQGLTAMLHKTRSNEVNTRLFWSQLVKPNRGILKREDHIDGFTKAMLISSITSSETFHRDDCRLRNQKSRWPGAI